MRMIAVNAAHIAVLRSEQKGTTLRKKRDGLHMTPSAPPSCTACLNAGRKVEARSYSLILASNVCRVMVPLGPQWPSSEFASKCLSVVIPCAKRGSTPFCRPFEYSAP